ncbi:MAG: alpha/beta hydrolase [Pedobacter sp.]|nr:alpha/beta hydrolase [Pedobacter sp.]MDQ8051374.1 alpha/beta hydrolase [Pedobacter sp.]
MKSFTQILIYTLMALSTSVVGQVRVAKDINYAHNGQRENNLNIYYPKQKGKHDVIIFIHGGSWSSGKKETYWWLGRNFAKQGVVTVIINYPLAPQATFKEMGLASAQAVKWVKDSISNYGGHPDRIFLMGHSAGGHLCELINADPQYFAAVKLSNPIKGVILNDAFGLDMDEYLSKAEKDHYYQDFIRTFSTESKTWQLGSPLFYAKNIKNSHLIFYGTRTYEAIKLQSERMFQVLRTQQVPVTLHQVEGKKHVGMVSQLIWGTNPLYQQILGFLAATP